MAARIIHFAVALLGRLRRRPGYMFLTAGDEVLAAQLPVRFAFVWLDLMVLSGAWGGLSVLLYSWTWGLFGDYSGIPFMPVAAVLTVGTLLLYRRSVTALAESLSKTGTAVMAITCLILLVQTLCLLGLKSWNPDFPQYLPPTWQWLRPRTMFRPLLLAPLWGGWAMLAACQFCKPGGTTEPVVAAMARGCGPAVTAMSLAAVLTATILYFNHLPWMQLSISAMPMAVAILGGPLLGWKDGSLSRRVLLANNLLAQIAFLLAYLANR
jgi:hypothetical protein